MIDFLKNNIVTILIGLIVIFIVVIIIFRNKIYCLLKKAVESIKDITVDTIHFFIKILSRLEVYLLKNRLIINSHKLEDLTPHLTNEQREEYEKIQNTYIESIKYGILNKNVISIALTGGFGTGKSTIINEFVNQNKGYDYLRISLANFNIDEVDERVIETSILQQIIYFEKKEKLKESSFKRIKYTKWWYKIFMSTFFVIWLYSCVYLFFDNINKKIAFLGELKIYKHTFHILFIAGLFYFIYKTYDAIKNFRLSKLTPNDFEIINDKDEHQLSVFNRNIEEIIYFFEKTNTNIVILEDIDRFKAETAQRLFSKVRELSFLIKESKNISQSVKFIYAVKDELLTDAKTKFFDLIIPVLPITDYSNSKNIFLKKLNDFFEANEIETVEEIDEVKLQNNKTDIVDNKHNVSYLDKDFISEVAYYVYDMRTIINICNEYKIYYKIQETNKSTTNQNKLFALVLYKNLFPEDFAKIQLGNSKLHKIFKRESTSLLVKKINNDILKEIDDKIKNKQEEIDVKIKASNNHILKDIEELRKIYLFNIIEKINLKNHCPLNIEGIKINDLIENESNFNILRKSKNIKYNYQDYLHISFQSIENEINPDLKYEKREKIIKDFHNEELVKLNQELRNLYWVKNEIEFSNVQKLFEDYPDDMELFIKCIYKLEKNNKNVIYKENLFFSLINSEGKLEEFEVDSNISLILNLVRNGYLTEDFTNYLSYFYPGSLTHNDYSLLMKIIGNKSTKFDENIDNVANLIKEINNLHFKNNDKIIILEIFKHLLIDSQDPKKRNPKLDDFLYQITNFKDESARFLELFIKTILIDKKDNKLFSNFIIEFVKWDNFWLLISSKFEDDNLKRQILLFLFQFFNEISSSTIIGLNKQDSITNFINNDSNFLIDIYDKISISSFIKTLQELKVSLIKINNNNKINNLLEEVYKKNLYKLNIENILLFANFDLLYTYDEKEFKETNYTFLNSKNETSLWQRIGNNLNEYLENVYLKLEENNKEKASIIQFLLESEAVKEKTKRDIIVKGFVGKIKSIENIKEYSVAESLFNYNKVENSWQTIIEFTVWEDYDFNLIVEFINNNENYKDLSINDIYNNYGNYFEEEKEFFDFAYKLINNLKLNNTSFESIFNNSIDLKLTVSEIKIDHKIVIKDKKTNSLKELRIIHLIEKNYIDLNKEEFEYLNKNDKKSLKKLVEKNEDKFIENISIFELGIDFFEVLLDSSISDDNKIKIINSKEDLILYGDNIKVEIVNKIIDLFISNNFSNYSSYLFHELLSIINNENRKIEFFNFHFKQVDSDNTLIKNALENMGEKFKKIIYNENVKFDSVNMNREFLNILKSNQYIYNFRKQKDNLIVYY